MADSRALASVADQLAEDLRELPPMFAASHRELAKKLRRQVEREHGRTPRWNGCAYTLDTERGAIAFHSRRDAEQAAELLLSLRASSSEIESRIRASEWHVTEGLTTWWIEVVRVTPTHIGLMILSSSDVRPGGRWNTYAATWARITEGLDSGGVWAVPHPVWTALCDLLHRRFPSVSEDEGGSRIRTARLVAGMTQAELGARIGVSDRTVHGWEALGRAPRLPQARAVAAALGVSVDWLAGVPGSKGPVL